MVAGVQYRFDDIVMAIGNAATEVLLRSGGRELTFSTSARDAWVAHMDAAVRRMVREDRTDDEALDAAQEAARTVIRIAAEGASRSGDEITEPDLLEAIRVADVWPFASMPGESRIPAGHEAAARRAAASLLEQQVLRIREFLRDLPEDADPIPRLAPMLALSRTALDAVQAPAFFLGTCPDDGTRVEYDQSIQQYCCAYRHCSPG